MGKSFPARTALLTGSTLGNHNVTATTTYALYRDQLAYSRVDGRYASGTEDIRIVMGPEGYGHAASAISAVTPTTWTHSWR